MSKTYTFELTEDETFFVVASLYLATAALTKNKTDTLRAIEALADTDGEVHESTALKFQSVVLPTS
jgi:hypothetical protein